MLGKIERGIREGLSCSAGMRVQPIVESRGGTTFILTILCTEPEAQFKEGWSPHEVSVYNYLMQSPCSDVKPSEYQCMNLS